MTWFGLALFIPLVVYLEKSRRHYEALQEEELKTIEKEVAEMRKNLEPANQQIKERTERLYRMLGGDGSV